MQIKRIWRFVKWSIQGFGWFEYSWFFCAALMSAGIVAGEGQTRQVLFSISAAIFAFWMLKFVFLDMGRMAWNRFVEDDERVLNILKDKNIK